MSNDILSPILPLTDWRIKQCNEDQHLAGDGQWDAAEPQGAAVRGDSKSVRNESVGFVKAKKSILTTKTRKSFNGLSQNKDGLFRSESPGRVHDINACLFKPSNGPATLLCFPMSRRL